MVLFYAIVAIGLLFAVIVAIKRWLPFDVCAICTSVSTVWVMLLALYHLGAIVDATVIAILMGLSSLGIYYAVERRVPERLLLFRLPFLLSLVVIAYTLILMTVPVMVLGVLGLLWFGFAVIYVSRRNVRYSVVVKRLIDCCSGW